MSSDSIIASLLRGEEEWDRRSTSFTLVAGLLDLEKGTQYDFSPQQIEDMKTIGFCFKEFYLPCECPMPSDLKCLDGTFNIQHSVAMEERAPLFIIHGEADKNVPLVNGQDLYQAAAEPKQWLAIPKANHLLSNSKHMKKVCSQIVQFIERVYD